MARPFPGQPASTSPERLDGRWKRLGGDRKGGGSCESGQREGAADPGNQGDQGKNRGIGDGHKKAQKERSHGRAGTGWIGRLGDWRGQVTGGESG